MIAFRALRRHHKWVAAAAASTVVVTVLSPVTAATAAVSAQPSRPPQVPAVTGARNAAFHFAKLPDRASRKYTASATAWPPAASAPVTLAAPGAGAGRRGTASRAGGTPVWAQAVAGQHGYTGPRSLNVAVLSHASALAAGVSGALFTVSAAGSAAGTVRVGLDYKTFAQAYGGNYGSRLTLVRLPACALTSPHKPACRTQTPLGSANNTAAGSVAAQVAVGPSASPLAPAASGSAPAAISPALSTVVLAATSSAGQEGGAGGSYAATSLKPSGTWSGGGNTGAFTYSYPVSVPPAASNLVPDAGLSYDSSSVDGQTASTQAQAPWAGDGWSTGESFIEQSYIPCSDKPEGTASPAATPDECYDGPVLTVSLDGASTPLVCNAAETSCQAADDTGEVIKHVTGSGNGTGTYNTDYWTITERDGTTYSFGRNQLPGWAAGKPATNSVASMPVYSAHSGDPCYKSTGFADSVCTMAYRWNLDYVKDVHGNAMAYYYQQSANYYGEDNGAHNVSYVRDTHLDHIDYGFTDGNAYGTVPDKVVYKTGDRCVSGTCDPLNAADSANWPDVPFDLICAAGATCTPSQYAPSFFSTVRLTSIATEQWVPSSSSYATVDSYALDTAHFPATGDGTSPTLWLASITRTGSDTTAGGSSPVTLPPVTFTGIDLPNRVDTVTDGLPPLVRYRIATITTETGSVISPAYYRPAPCTAPVTITPASNTSSCYPVYWTPPDYTAPFLDWFNTWAVQAVTQSDPTGGAPVAQTSYQYPGGAAWHYDDNEVVQPKYRTYGQFRGYGDVITRTGDGTSDKQTESEVTYYRGMSDDNNTTAVTVTDSAGGSHQDLNQLAGQPLEDTAYLGSGGPVDHSTITSYWVSPAAATRTRPGLPDLTANWAAPAETYTRQALTSTGTTTWRYTETDTAYDATVSDANFGLPLHTYTHTVPADTAYDTCQTTSYAAANSAENLAGLPAEAETDSVACGGFTEGTPASVPAALNTLTAPASVSRPAQVVSDTRTFYDDPAYSTAFPQPSAPSKGDVTMTQKASGYSGGAFSYQTASRTAYDSYGRPVTAFDANANKTTTSYAMSSGLVTGTTVTNPLSQATTTTLDPQRGLTLTTTDPNGVVTTEQYDALGRVTGVWQDSRTAASGPANYAFTYQVSASGLTAVTTKKLNNEGGQQTSVLVYDAMLRPRQSQAMTPQGGRLVTDTFYDTRGWTEATFTGWWDPGSTPAVGLATASDLAGHAHDEDYYTYDGLGRQVIDDSEDGGAVISATTTVYNGDRTTVVPDQGGTVKTTITDPLGRTTALNEYSARPAVTVPADPNTGLFTVAGGTYDTTSYAYDGHGNQATVTAAGRTWTSVYNLLGQVTSRADPDAGASSMTYDGNGNLLQSTDSRNKTISYTYDALNRKTGQYDAPVSSQSPSDQLASWVYDNSNNAVTSMTNPIGHLTTETAYWGGAAYTMQEQGFNVFGEPSQETITIPSATEGALGNAYVFQHTYTQLTGLPQKDIYPAAGGLPAETVLYHYATGLDLPATVGGLTGYAEGVTYDAYGRVNEEIIGAAPDTATIDDTWDLHTGTLSSQLIKRQAATPATVDNTAYTYDKAGNITSQTDTQLGSTATSETQCYAYDQLARLSAAWTGTDNCATAPTASDNSMVGDNLDSASAYWTSWGFDTLGDRTTQVQHATGTGGTDTTTSYTYSPSQPDTLTATAASSGSPGTTSYGYDTAGNMTSRTAGQGSQTLTWDDAGQLTAITGSTTGDSSFVYDAGGNLLIEKDPGSATLYLPGEQLTLNTTTQAVTGIRYYPLPGGGTAYRTGTTTATTGYEIADQNGTNLLTLDSTAQIPAWRQQTPYGAPRGTAATWIDNRAFLDKPADPATGLDIIGARQYDPLTGRFISDDPLLEPQNLQQLNGYSYAADNPVTDADPTGLMACAGPGTSDCSVQGHPPPPPSYGGGNQNQTPIPPSPFSGSGGNTGSGSPQAAENPCVKHPAGSICWPLNTQLNSADQPQEGPGNSYNWDIPVSVCTALALGLPATCPKISISAATGGSPSESSDSQSGSGNFYLDLINFLFGAGGRAAGDAAEDTGILYRADSRGPEEIFSKGFEPQGDNMNLMEHVRYTNPQEDGYVSTSMSREFSQDWAVEHGYDYVYKLRATGVNVNAELGDESPYPWEQEIAVPRAIPGTAIEGVWGPDGWVANPGFVP